MSATVSVVKRDKYVGSWVVWADVSLDTSYPNTGTFATTGYNIQPGAVGLTNFLGAVAVSTNAAALGYTIQWDNVNANIHVLVMPAVATAGPLPEVANATNLSALTVRMRFEALQA